jgi:hypothetical protein
MPRSIVLFIVLAAAGVLAGITLSNRAPSPGATPAAAPPPASAPRLGDAADAMAVLAPADSSKGSSQNPQIRILQNQVGYLEEQVKALQKENSELIDKLASLTRKPESATPSAPPLSSPPCDPGAPTVADEPDFVGIGIELLKIRGIKDIPLPTVTVPRAEVEKRINAWLATQVSADHGKLQGRALAALGVIPEPVDTMVLKAAFLSHQIGGWYDPAEQTLFLARQEEGGIVNDAAKENALALSYGCLLKRFGPSLYPKNVKVATLDARISRDCLIAGDAALLRFLHAMQNPKTGGGGGVGEDPDDPSRGVPIPNYLRELELLPFAVGFDFMQAMHSIGEWDQVNATYQRPPVAGAEVMDSRVYLSEVPFTPRAIEFPDPVVNGLTPFWQDTLGPMATVTLLKQRVAEALASDTAPGWVNDRLMAYAADGKPRGHVVWQTLWRDTDAADGFFSAARQWLQGRYKDAKPASEGSEAGVFTMENGERFVQLQRTHGGKGVMLVDGADAGFVKAAAAKLIP